MKEYKQRNIHNQWKRLLSPYAAALTVLAVAPAAVTGCSNAGIPIVSEVREHQGYSDAQAMIVITTEKNRYRDVYGDEIWQVGIDTSGTTFQAYLLKEVHDFLDEWKVLNLMAEEHQITLSGQEKERLRELTEAYFSSLTAEDIAYMGIKKEDVSYLYEQYHLANRVVEELTKDVNLEISDSEAKIITVQELKVNDAGTAREAYEKVMAEGADFAAIARSYSVDTGIEKQVGRGERSQVYEEAVFSLAAGEVSPVITDDDVFYIVKCLSDYDEAATLDRKQRLSLLRKDQAFRQIYDTFATEHAIGSKGAVWNHVSFTTDDHSTTTNFFELYQEYMNYN